jgi:hypothetical protein
MEADFSLIAVRDAKELGKCAGHIARKWVGVGFGALTAIFG